MDDFDWWRFAEVSAAVAGAVAAWVAAVVAILTLAYVVIKGSS